MSTQGLKYKHLEAYHSESG